MTVGLGEVVEVAVVVEVVVMEAAFVLSGGSEGAQQICSSVTLFPPLFPSITEILLQGNVSKHHTGLLSLLPSSMIYP